jgi:hypothetical protein
MEQKIMKKILIKQVQIAQKLDKTKNLSKKHEILEKYLKALEAVLK